MKKKKKKKCRKKKITGSKSGHSLPSKIRTAKKKSTLQYTRDTAFTARWCTDYRSPFAHCFV